jgi:hypothetical protein
MLRRTLGPIRFASTTSTQATSTPGQSTSWCADLPPHDEAGPSNYASRPFRRHEQKSTASQASAESTSGFFTSHRSPVNPLQEHLAKLSESGTDALDEFQRVISKPVRLRDAYADTDAAWQRYNSLAPAVRSSLDYGTLHNTLRAVVPPRHILKSGERAALRGGKYGLRLVKVLQDIETLELPASIWRESDYRFVFSTLAQIGESRTAEHIADEMRTRGRPMDIRMINSRLTALCESIRISKSVEFSESHGQSVATALWKLLGDLSTFQLAPKDISMTLIVRAIYLAKKRIVTPRVTANLDLVLEDLYAKVYGVDMRYMTVSDQSKLKAEHVYVLLDYWGGKGEVWKMLSAYEVMVEMEATSVTGTAVAGDLQEEGAVETLSSLLMSERESSKGMTMFGMKRSGVTELSGGTTASEFTVVPILEDTLPCKSSSERQAPI